MVEIASISRPTSLGYRLITASILTLILFGCDGRQQQSTQVQGPQPVRDTSGQPPASTTTPSTPADQSTAATGAASTVTPTETQVGAKDEDDAATAAGLSKSEAEQGKLYINGWDGLNDEIPTTSNWTVANTSITSAPPASTPSTGGSTPSKVTYDGEIRTLLSSNCTNCHRTGGTRAQSPLTTYNEVKSHAADLVSRIVAGTMPTGSALPKAQQDTFSAWKSAGFPEKSTTGSTIPSGTTGTTTTTTTAGGGVEFHIKSGTGSGAWNTKDTEVVARAGQKFTLINDDSVSHQWHTNGAPCSHGNEIKPGASATCTASPYSGEALYDHNTNGKFYIRAE